MIEKRFKYMGKHPKYEEMMQIGKYMLILLLILPASWSLRAQVRLPRLISDGMVLQRDVDVKIWGWAGANESIEVDFLEKNYQTTADSNGNWSIQLGVLKPGGPYEMDIQASNHLVVNNIVVGDVWLCSGQSNMEIPMRRVSWIYPQEIKNANYPLIRQFYVPRKFNYQNPQSDISSGSWIAANPQSVLDFSAAAYFFAKDLFEQYQVPVGIINSALGGSAAESWISEEAIKNFPKYYKELTKLKDSVWMQEVADRSARIQNEWTQSAVEKDKGHKDPENNWHQEALDTDDWPVMNLPGFWTAGALGKVSGIVWFRKKVNIPEAMAGQPAKLILGRIIDSDSAFVNGQFVGTTGYQYPPRRYDIPEGALKVGENTIVVKVVNNGGKGGFVEDKDYQIEFEEAIVDLKGPWKYQVGATMDPVAYPSSIKFKPIGLYNAMIAPLHNYSIKGAVWYQGETNAGRWSDYTQLMATLIGDWRTRWHEDFPFVYIQLPNFGTAQIEPSEGGWAYMREAQLRVLSVPNTAMAVTIDVGEWNDIHPLRKKEVGTRAALAARKIAYHEDALVYSGPVYQSMKIKKSRVILSFSNTGSGLLDKGDAGLTNFSIAGSDGQFVWAQAKVDGDQVIVWSDQVKDPVAVRYAWASNPEGADLYNEEGLPASPFRTDEWDRK